MYIDKRYLSVPPDYAGMEIAASRAVDIIVESGAKEIILYLDGSANYYIQGAYFRIYSDLYKLGYSNIHKITSSVGLRGSQADIYLWFEPRVCNGSQGSLHSHVLSDGKLETATVLHVHNA